MVLRNLFIAGRKGKWDLGIRKNLIGYVAQSDVAAFSDNHVLDLSGCIAFPGLINSHDHLDFNLFPPLASRIYNNYRDWGSDIHIRYKQRIDAVLKVPLPLRVEWGLYKNLLNGVTTVVNHGARLQINSELITVHQDCISLHSPAFEKRWRWKLNASKQSGLPVAMHVGEGTDIVSYREIESVLAWNLRRKKLIGIHGIMMNVEQAKGFSALVWCPESNYFLFDRTADVALLKTHTQILFGTDSTLTGDWNLFNHVKRALKSEMMTARELLFALTEAAAETWNLDRVGSIDKHYHADILVASGINDFSEMNSTHLTLILHKGQLRLFDEALKPQLIHTGFALKDFHPIRLGDQIKFIYGNLPGLLKHIEHYYPASPYSSYFRP